MDQINITIDTNLMQRQRQIDIGNFALAMAAYTAAIDPHKFAISDLNMNIQRLALPIAALIMLIWVVLASETSYKRYRNAVITAFRLCQSTLPVIRSPQGLASRLDVAPSENGWFGELLRIIFGKYSVYTSNGFKEREIRCLRDV